jgi:hypothetical protein
MPRGIVRGNRLTSHTHTHTNTLEKMAQLSAGGMSGPTAGSGPGSGSGSNSSGEMDRGRIVLQGMQNECWRHFIDRGMFDSTYALRVSSCFRYMCGSPDSSCFTLRDFADKGKLVIPYLCINLSTSETNFAIMDIFRRFDKSATGKIFIDDFVVGVMACINRCNVDDSYIRAIIRELMPSGSCIAGQIYSILFSMNPGQSASNGGPQRSPAFHHYFSAIEYIVKQSFDVFLASEKEKMVAGSAGMILPWNVDVMNIVVDDEAVTKILKDSINIAIVELQDEFHTPWHRIKSVLADHGDSSFDENIALKDAGRNVNPQQPSTTAKTSWVVRSQGSRLDLSGDGNMALTSGQLKSTVGTSQKLSSSTSLHRKKSGGIAGFQDVALNTVISFIRLLRLCFRFIGCL